MSMGYTWAQYVIDVDRVWQTLCQRHGRQDGPSRKTWEDGMLEAAPPGFFDSAPEVAKDYVRLKMEESQQLVEEDKICRTPPPESLRLLGGHRDQAAAGLELRRLHEDPRESQNFSPPLSSPSRLTTVFPHRLETTDPYLPFVDACAAVFDQIHPHGRDSTSTQQQQAWRTWRGCMEEAMPRELYRQLEGEEKGTVNGEVMSLPYWFTFRGFEHAPTPQDHRYRDLFPMIIDMRRKYLVGGHEAHRDEHIGGPAASSRHANGITLERTRKIRRTEDFEKYWWDAEKNDFSQNNKLLYEGMVKYPPAGGAWVHKLPKSPLTVPRWIAIQDYIHTKTGVQIPHKILRARAVTSGFQEERAKEEEDKRRANPSSVYLPQSRQLHPPHHYGQQ
ncbi:hypothetical protein JCM10213v2_009183 [Rhodosporidiobolus nylandii]